MLQLKCIATGSSGNCYLLRYQNETNYYTETLIIELGIKSDFIFRNIKDITEVKGIIYTHNHGDHNYKISKDKRNSDLFREYGLNVYGVDNLKVGEKVKLGMFTITALPSVHDVECYSYLIEIENRKILFATDTNRLVSIKNCVIDTFVVEINHSIELMNKVINEFEERTELDMQAEKSSVNHMALETMCKYFDNLHYEPKNIIVIHSSSKRWFNKKQTLEEMRKYSENIDIAKGGGTYVL